MTDAERVIWKRIRNNQLGYKFRRQEPIGDYVVDFVCYDKKLILEIDGSQHIDSSEDEKRDEYFAENNYTVLRFFNNIVLSKTDDVLQRIWDQINQ